MPDWQFITVLALITGAAGLLALRTARFFKVRHKDSSGCGGACRGCQQPEPSKAVISLDLPQSAREPER